MQGSLRRYTRDTGFICFRHVPADVSLSLVWHALLFCVFLCSRPIRLAKVRPQERSVSLLKSPAIPNSIGQQSA